jgi:hypothetical protein
VTTVSEAKKALAEERLDDASTLIQNGQGISARLLAVKRPPLEAMQAVSDLDQIYGNMLMSNRHYGWARMQFQKNVARWKNWRPQTDDTARRRKEAEDAIAECDRKIAQ